MWQTVLCFAPVSPYITLSDLHGCSRYVLMHVRHQLKDRCLVMCLIFSQVAQRNSLKRLHHIKVVALNVKRCSQLPKILQLCRGLLSCWNELLNEEEIAFSDILLRFLHCRKIAFRFLPKVFSYVCPMHKRSIQRPLLWPSLKHALFGSGHAMHFRLRQSKVRTRWTFTEVPRLTCSQSCLSWKALTDNKISRIAKWYHSEK